MSKSKLPITEDLDFEYLLALMPALHNISGFSWLPELFSIVGCESLILLCRYCGGETITIPTTDQLLDSIESLHNFYDIHIKKCKKLSDLPIDKQKSVQIIQKVYNVTDC